MRSRLLAQRPIRRILLCRLFLLLTPVSGVGGQGMDTVVVAPGPQYRANLPLGFLGNRVYGARYRSAWTSPIPMSRFDPARFAGGLTLVFADTGLRAGSTYFRAADGAFWTFRTLDPNLSAGLPEGMRKQAVTEALDDLASGGLPGAALVVRPLAEAVGARAPPTLLVVWDSLPGYLRAGIGTPYLDELGPGDGSTTSAALLERMAGTTPVVADAGQYLRERLLDIYLGHWDLEPQHWRWAPDGRGGWTPAERHRDGAFSRYDGLITLFVAAGLPQFTTFGPNYDRNLGVTFQTRVLDRWILTGLPDSAWDAAATAMQTALTDSVIGSALRQLPAPYQPLLAAELTEQLRRRRDQLPEAARRFRAIVLDQAEVYGSGGPDTVLVTRAKDGALDVRAGQRFHRRFDPLVTSYVHLYLLGGADHVVVGGPRAPGPILQIAGTAGMSLIDSSGSRLELFTPGEVSVTGPGEVRRRDKSLATPLLADTLRGDLPPLPGSQSAPVLWVDITSDLGLFLGGGFSRTTYRPDFIPYQDRMQLRGGWATTPMAGAIDFAGQWRLSPSSGPSLILDAKYSAIEILNFFGYGNETVRDADQPDQYYKAGQTQLIFAPGLRLPVGPAGRFDVAMVYKSVHTTDDTTRFITQQDPYGIAQSFEQLGARMALSLDTRDHPYMSSRGIWLQAAGTVYPGTMDAEKPFGSLQASMAGAVTPAGFQSLTLAGRASGAYAWGKYPVHEAAYLGGSNTMRSLKNGRFAGNASLYGNLDARLRVATLPFILRWDVGVYGLGDLGRVFVEDESSQRWHYSAGGGIWIAVADRSVVGRLEIAGGDDGTAFRFGTAFKF